MLVMVNWMPKASLMGCKAYNEKFHFRNNFSRYLLINRYALDNFAIIYNHFSSLSTQVHSFSFALKKSSFTSCLHVYRFSRFFAELLMFFPLFSFHFP